MSSCTYLCDGCSAEKTLAYEGVRIRYPCQICGATTDWTRSDQAQREVSP